MKRKDARSLSPVEQAKLRKSAVRLVRFGKSPNEVAHSLGVSKRAVEKWWRSFGDSDGYNALLPKPRGRPSRSATERLDYPAKRETLPQREINRLTVRRAAALLGKGLSGRAQRKLLSAMASRKHEDATLAEVLAKSWKVRCMPGAVVVEYKTVASGRSLCRLTARLRRRGIRRKEDYLLRSRSQGQRTIYWRVTSHNRPRIMSADPKVRPTLAGVLSRQAWRLDKEDSAEVYEVFRDSLADALKLEDALRVAGRAWGLTAIDGAKYFLNLLHKSEQDEARDASRRRTDAAPVQYASFEELHPKVHQQKKPKRGDS